MKSLELRLKATLLISGTLMATACVPGPHRMYQLADMHGYLWSATGPAVGAEVLVSRNGMNDTAPCKDAEVVGTTGVDGAFSVSARSHIALTRDLLNPPATLKQLTTLCFRVKGSEAVLGDQTVIPTQGPTHLEFQCYLAGTQVVSALGLKQICRSREHTPRAQRLR